MAFIVEEDFIKSEYQIALCCVLYRHDDQPSTHCGIVFKERLNTKEIVFSHHGWHNNLYWENYLPKDNKLFVGLDEYSELRDPNRYITDPFINLLSTFYDKNKDSLSYGLFFDDLIEAHGDGELNEIGKKHGLTCSTYVIVMFKSYLKPLLNTKTWKQRESDKVFKERIIWLMEKTDVSAEHIDNVKKQDIPFRFKPEEVVSAGLKYPSIPSFEFCEAMGTELYNTLVA